jgi:hypothetical protein
MERRETMCIDQAPMWKHVLPARASTWAVLAVLVLTVWTLASTAEAGSVNLQVFAPKDGTLAGVEGRGWFVDLRARFDGDLASTGMSIRTTPPGGAGAAKDFPGLVVLVSSAKPGAGPGQNFANAFNIIGVTDRDAADGNDTEIWATWIIGAANFGDKGTLTESRLFVAVVDGLAPNVVIDKNGDGIFDEKDLELMGFDVISNVVKRHFIVNGF